jgi:hypothetical protein
MIHNGKRMKHEATHLGEAQRCEIITKLSKPNVLSKRGLGPEYEVNEGAIPKVWDNRENILQRIICCESLSRHLLNMKVLLPSKALKLYTTLSSTSTTNCFAPMFKRKLSNICMMNCDDRLRCFNETLTHWHWMSNVTNSCIRGKWLYMTCSKKNMNPNFCQKNCALKREITVVS